VKILVIGAGSIGGKHLLNLSRMKAGELSVCETDPARLEQVCRTFGIPGFMELEKALAQKPDAVIVATPTHLHTPVALEALKTVKNLFIEKPIADTLEQAERLTADAARRKAMVLVGCNLRFHPGVASLKTALAAGLLKKPLSVRAWFSHYLPNWRPGSDYRKTYSARSDQAGGILLECVHELDYLRWMLGEISGLDCFCEQISELEIDSEDIAWMRLHFKSGTIGQIQMDYLSPLKMRGCELIGTDGILRWSSEGKSPERVLVQHFDPAQGTWHDLVRLESYDSNQMYLQELRHFLDCASGTAEPMMDAKAATEVLGLALRAKQKSAACSSAQEIL